MKKRTKKVSKSPKAKRLSSTMLVLVGFGLASWTFIGISMLEFLPKSTVLGTNTYLVREGVPVYRVNGASAQKLLGVFPVSIEKNMVASKETGEVIAQHTSFIHKILDVLAF